MWNGLVRIRQTVSGNKVFMVSKCPIVHSGVPLFIDGKLNYFRVQETSSCRRLKKSGHLLSRERHKTMGYLMSEIVAL